MVQSEVSHTNSTGGFPWDTPPNRQIFPSNHNPQPYTARHPIIRSAHQPPSTTTDRGQLRTESEEHRPPAPPTHYPPSSSFLPPDGNCGFQSPHFLALSPKTSNGFFRHPIDGVVITSRQFARLSSAHRSPTHSPPLGRTPCGSLFSATLQQRFSSCLK